MLKKGFLGQLSDWVVEQTYKDKIALENAANVFELYQCLEKTNDAEKVVGLFSEWLVFDHKQEIFANLTGLEYFINHNPLNLPDNEILRYKDLLEFEVGLFEVEKIERGKGVVLLSIAGNNKNFIHDINSSLFLRLNNTIWTRIAPVGGVYYMVGSVFFQIPIKIMEGMRQEISKWKRNSIDARAIVSWLQNSEQEKEGDYSHKNFSNGQILSREEAEQNFLKALRRCGMEKFFTIETFKEWIVNEKKYGFDFAVKALNYLIPEKTDENDINTLIKTASEFANSIPRESLKGKTPNEAIFEIGNKERKLELNIYSQEKYLKILELASEYMAKGDFKESYKAFEQTIKDLLNDKVPFFHAFRVYTNAAVCCFHMGENMLGEELISAALRINPLYDFAIKCKSRYANFYNDSFTALKMPKEEKQITTSFRKDMGVMGRRQYQQRVFSKYEKFLKDIGVFLEYKTKTIPIVYSYGKNGSVSGQKLKISRNEPCYCGSGKKYKKCHGV